MLQDIPDFEQLLPAIRKAAAREQEWQRKNELRTAVSRRLREMDVTTGLEERPDPEPLLAEHEPAITDVVQRSGASVNLSSARSAPSAETSRSSQTDAVARSPAEEEGGLAQSLPTSALVKLPQSRTQRGVFICYRRTDRSFAGRVRDRISSALGELHVFMDVDSIDYGVDFVEELERQLGECAVLLVIIGPKWLTEADDEGRQRLFLADDYVRLEVERGLSRSDVRVIPVLEDTVAMPLAEQLPEPISSLARRNACIIYNDRRFKTDTDVLISAIRRATAI